MHLTYTPLQTEVDHVKTDFRRNNFDNSGAAIVTTVKYICSLFVVIDVHWLAHNTPAREDVSTHQHKHTAETLQSFKNPMGRIHFCDNAHT